MPVAETGRQPRLDGRPLSVIPRSWDWVLGQGQWEKEPCKQQALQVVEGESKETH